ncbi:hypothetical protein BIU82_12350 [Arthrobacter sp. SW1]|nr:hypothetical protein BIU82_12350 [Arthrobacter sp. SW1]
MRDRPLPSRRLLVAAGALLGAGLAFTDAQYAEALRGHTSFVPDPGRNGFNIMVTGAEGDRLPAGTAWAEGNPQAFEIGSSSGFGPGTSKTFTLGVRNASPELASDVQLSLFDAAPSSAAGTGLFDILRFTVTQGDGPDGGRQLAVDVPGSARELLAGLRLEELAPGGITTVRLTVAFPGWADNSWQGKGAQLAARVDGSSK